MAKTIQKLRQISTRIPTRSYKAMEKLGKASERSVSAETRVAIENHIERGGKL